MSGGRALEDLDGRAASVSVRTWLVRAGGKHLQKALVLSLSCCREASPLDATPPPALNWSPAGPAGPGRQPSVQLVLLFDDL